MRLERSRAHKIELVLRGGPSKVLSPVFGTRFQVEVMPQLRAAAQPTSLGRYTLIQRLGTGGQGEVWRAHDESRGVDIALKILAPSVARNPAAWEALEREHAIASRLQHPGILQVLAPERLQDAVVLPMELAAGGDLRRLRGAGYLEIVPVLLEVAEALEYAHARGVVHRDLKPGNVLFDSRGRVKLADFGIAALVCADGDAVAGSGAGHSPFSASPEQLRGEPASASDDIYGLGALAYELLSGRPPYYPHFDFRRAQTQPVPELVPTRQIPPELGELVMHMLAKSASERPHSMQQVMDELDATLNATLSFAPDAVEGGDADSPPPSPPESPIAPPPLTAGAAERAARVESRPPPEPKPARAATEARTSAPAIAAPAPANDVRTSRAAPAPVVARPAPIAAELAPVAARPAPIAAEPTPEVSVPPPPHAAEAQARTPAAPAEPIRAGNPFSLGVIEAPPRDRRTLATARRAPTPAADGRARHWPYLVSGVLCGAVLICGLTVAALFWLPRYDRAGLQQLLANISSFASSPSTPAATPHVPATAPIAVKPGASPRAPAPASKAHIDPAALAAFNSARADLGQRLAALQARGAAVWDGADLSSAQMQSAEASGAAAAGGLDIALQHLNQAKQFLAEAANKEPQAVAAELKAGDAALAAGQQRQATEAYALARRIDPNNRRAIDGERHARLLSGVLPLLVDARNAEAAHNYSQAAQDFSQALALDPGNALAKSGLARANAAFGDDNYARAVGAGFAALGAGRLLDARTDFQQALGFRAQGREATAGLQRVDAAVQASRIAALRQQAASLEQQEHWRQAMAVYDTALQQDPSLAFAQRGKARDESRLALSSSLQHIIDHPQQLTIQSVRDEAVMLLQEAREATPSGPVLQSQTERLAELLPQLDRPVLLNLISDNATQVTIPSIGVFGTFGRREIRLKPGTYTVIGTRDGYRAVHQEFTVEPGQQSLTITVSCSEPI
jgi:tetratricopeptide (TPR) repeat protein